MTRLGSLWTLMGLMFVATFAIGCGGGDTPNPAADAGTDAGSECPPGQHPDGLGGCTTDPCTPSPCTQAGKTTCVAQGGTATCQCDPGYHDEGGSCVPDTTCMPATCSNHGTCNDMGGTPSCSCDTGYTGPNCQSCDTQGGYIPDGMGGCTNTPCTPNPCPSDKSLCTVQNDMIVCECSPGTHDENGVCVPDPTCMPTTCAGHGTCSDTGGTVSCTCDAGWAPPFCGACDDTQGYHPDGMGGCTQDPCLPNPCQDPNKTVCASQGGMTTCSCDVGYHDEGGACVMDQTCMPNSCNGHGTCSDTGGIVVCACDSGYQGSSCADCDLAGGYHPDGMGGCTQDPCLPNPCSDPNKTVCTANGPLAVCSCDPGYHDDGTGACTNDPCQPNPCAAQNQACTNNNGQPECYTPVCDDQNPCTTDTVVNGSCVYTTLPDNSACSTTLCTSGQTCQAGACVGGTPVSCSDNNPCTVDSCDAIMGCAHAVDDTIVPDDGIACTTDVCQNGAPKHTNTNALCDDGLYCTGSETCSPTDPQADASGCIHTSVPVAPPPLGPCAYYGACEEATQSFPLIKKATGSSCNDGIPCTSGDACDANGLCIGTPTASCTATSCTTTTPLPGTIDIPVAHVGGTITLGGQALPQTNTYGLSTTIYLKAKDTGSWHQLAYFNYTGTGYALYGPTWTSKLVPGIYDVLLRREWDRTYDTVSPTDATDQIPHGMRLLQSDVVLGAGLNTLDIDIPVATVSGNITLGGQPLPSTNTYGLSTTLYLKAKDTGAWHQLAYFNYTGTGNTLYGPTWTSKLVPGTYELLLRREWDRTYNTVSPTDATDQIPHGLRVLNDNLVITPGANTLNIDIPVANVSGNITLGGQPLPSTNTYGLSTTIYLKAKDTGSWHQLAYFNYTGTGNTLYGPTWTSKLVPGTYDVVLRREWDRTYDTVSPTDATDQIPHGMRLLATDVVVSPGANTLDIDIPVANVSGNITLGGQPLPSTNTYGLSTTIYLKAKDTGSWHQLAYFNYTGTGNTLYGPTWTSKLVPGTYDVLLRREWDRTYDTVSPTDATDQIPHGLRLLASDVVVSPGANTLNIDIPVTQVSGTVTLGGQPLPSTNTYGLSTTIYLKAKDTGSWHQIAYFNYTGTGNTLYGPTWTSKLVPGTYDVLLRREWDRTYDTVSPTDATDQIPHGLRLLASDVVLPPGAKTLNIDIPVAAMSGAITLAGAALPATNTYGLSTTIYLKARDTGSWHQLAYFNYTGTGNALYGPTWTSKIVPGTYDILLRREWDRTYDTVSPTDATDQIPHGLRLLGVCMNVP